VIFSGTLYEKFGEAVAAALSGRSNDEVPVVFSEFDFASDFEAEFDGEAFGDWDSAGVSPFLNDNGH
jgi:hypothetical protein